MSVHGYATIFERVFVPEEVVLIASTPQLEGIAKGVDSTERVEHQVHLAAHTLADGLNDGNLILDWRGLPAVNLVGGIAHFEALLGKVSVGFSGVQTTRL